MAAVRGERFNRNLDRHGWLGSTGYIDILQQEESTITVIMIIVEHFTGDP